LSVGCMCRASIAQRPYPDAISLRVVVLLNASAGVLQAHQGAETVFLTLGPGTPGLAGTDPPRVRYPLDRAQPCSGSKWPGHDRVRDVGGDLHRRGTLAGFLGPTLEMRQDRSRLFPACRMGVLS
jgi:hypothetical protein